MCTASVCSLLAQLHSCTHGHTQAQPRNVVSCVNQAGLFSLPSTHNVLTAPPHLTNMQRNTFLTCRVVVIGTGLYHFTSRCLRHSVTSQRDGDRDDCTFVARFSATTYSFLQFTHIQKLVYNKTVVHETPAQGLHCGELCRNHWLCQATPQRHIHRPPSANQGIIHGCTTAS